MAGEAAGGLSAPGPEINEKRPQAREAIAWIHVLLNHIKGEIVKPAETPDRDRQQDGGFDGRVFQDQEEGRENANDQEKNSFELDQCRTG
jgi:hypothetical protein